MLVILGVADLRTARLRTKPHHQNGLFDLDSGAISMANLLINLKILLRDLTICCLQRFN